MSLYTTNNMKINSKKITSLISGGTAFLSLFLTKTFAFTNPVLTGDLGGNGAGGSAAAEDGTTFLSYFIVIWNALISIGALMVLVYFLWGAIEWISAGGDSGKIEKARNRITQSILGLVILISAFVIIGFISNLFFGEEFSILNLNFIAP